MRTEEDVESGRTHIGAGPGPASVGTSVARRLDLGGSPRAPRAWYASCVNIPPEALLLATAAIWGSYHPTMRLMLTSEDGWETPTPAELNISRSAITAAMCIAQLLVMRWLDHRRGESPTTADPHRTFDEEDDPSPRTPLKGEGRRGRRLVATTTDKAGDADRGSDTEGASPHKRTHRTSGSRRQGSSDPHHTKKLLAASAELAGLHALTVGLQSCGVDHSSATRASFLATTSTVIVPLLATATGTAVSRKTWACAFLCVLGTALIVLSKEPATNNPSHDYSNSDTDSINDTDAADDTRLGDGLILLGAVTWGVFLLRISTHARTLPVAPLVIWRNVLMCIAYATWWAFDERFFRGGSEHMGFSRGRFSHGHGNVPIAREPFPWRLNPVTWSRVVFLAIGPGFACSWLQTLAQAQVDAAEAQVLMSTTPLWGAAWAFGMMGERMTALGWVGGGTIVAGAVLVADRTAAKKRPTLPPRGNKSS